MASLRQEVSLPEQLGLRKKLQGLDNARAPKSLTCVRIKNPCIRIKWHLDIIVRTILLTQHGQCVHWLVRLIIAANRVDWRWLGIGGNILAFMSVEAYAAG